MSDLTKKDIEAIINAVFDRRIGPGTETHEMHVLEHQFIKRMIEREDRKARNRERIKQQLIGWGFITIMSGLGIMAYQFIVSFISRVHGGGH